MVMPRFAALPALALILAAAGCQATGQGAALRPSVTAQELLGRDSVGVIGALGEPRRVRREASAQVWQYDGGSCVLDLFLYPEGTINRVVHLEARDSSNGKAVDTGQCLAKVQNPTRPT